MSIQSFLFTLHVMLQEYEQDSLTFLWDTLLKLLEN